MLPASMRFWVTLPETGARTEVNDWYVRASSAIALARSYSAWATFFCVVI